MKLSVWALACGFGVFWALAILVVGVANAVSPDYGQAFLQVIASLYPGYKGTPGIGQAVVAALYGLVDGAIAGAVFAWIYNFFVLRFAASDTA
jgi:hypothetical protein